MVLLTVTLLRHTLCYTGEPVLVYRFRQTQKTACAGVESVSPNWKFLLRGMMVVNLKAYLRTRSLNNFRFSSSVLLSGSALLQITLGRVWPIADTDVFCTENEVARVDLMLIEAGYTCVRTRQFDRPGLATQVDSMENELDSNDQGSDVMESMGMRDAPFQAVKTWMSVGPGMGMPLGIGTKIDVIVGMPGADNAHVLVENFDILVCCASYDGDLFRWTDPMATFNWETQLNPRIKYLLGGFILGWSEQDIFVDEYASQRVFLRSEILRRVMLFAMEFARDFYEPHLFERLREDIINSVHNHHFFFFHRQLERVVKYSRRGITVHGLPPFWNVWIGLQHICRLPH